MLKAVHSSAKNCDLKLRSSSLKIYACNTILSIHDFIPLIMTSIKLKTVFDGLLYTDSGSTLVTAARIY